MKPRILLLEDDVVLRDLLSSSLMNAGYEVFRVSRPEQALTLMDMTPFDLAIFDGDLPVMSGIDAMREALRRGYEGKFLFISARPGRFVPADQSEALRDELGILRVFQKPFPFQDLVDCIRELEQSELRELQQFASDDDLTAIQPMLFGQTPRLLMDLPQRVDKTPLPRLAVPPTPPPESSSFASTLTTSPPPEPLAPLPPEWSQEPDTNINGEPLSEELLDELFSGMSDAPVKEELFSLDDIEAIEISDGAVAALRGQHPQRGPSEDNISVQQQLRELQEEYGKKLQEHLYELIRLLRPIRLHLDQQALDQAIALSHKLKGTAGTLGFHDVSGMADWLELTLLDLKQKPDAFPSQRWDDIVERLEATLLRYQTPATT